MGLNRLYVKDSIVGLGRVALSENERHASQRKEGAEGKHGAQGVHKRKNEDGGDREREELVGLCRTRPFIRKRHAKTVSKPTYLPNLDRSTGVAPISCTANQDRKITPRRRTGTLKIGLTSALNILYTASQ